MNRVALISLGLLTASAAMAQTPLPRTEKDATPALSELSAETQRLCTEVRGCIVRIHFPVMSARIPSTNPADDPLAKWDSKLDPAVRERLRQQMREQAVAGQAGGARPSFRFATAEGAEAPMTLREQGMQPATSSASTQQSGEGLAVVGMVNFKTIGLVLDGDGHVLVPFFVEKERMADVPVHAMADDGTTALATLMGSDRQTGLSLFKLNPPCGKPLRLANVRPTNGALILSISPDLTMMRFVVWTGQAHSEAALIVQLDGALAGIARNGSFMGGPACQTVADQLIRFGRVKRARLGVEIVELGKDDPARDAFPALRGRAAVLVRRVAAETPAAKGGLQPGDLILALADEPVEDIPNFAAAITARQGLTNLRILRGDAETTVAVDLQPQ